MSHSDLNGHYCILPPFQSKHKTDRNAKELQLAVLTNNIKHNGRMSELEHQENVHLLPWDSHVL
eukprot:5743163-Amphidinium_carterae.1